jgi:hypothetical protein
MQEAAMSEDSKTTLYPWDESAYRTLLRFWRLHKLGKVRLSEGEGQHLEILLRAYEDAAELEPGAEFKLTNSPQAGTDGARSPSQSNPSQVGHSSEVRGSADTKPEDGPTIALTEELLRIRGLLVQCWNDRRQPLYEELREFFPDLASGFFGVTQSLTVTTHEQG